MDHVWSVEEYEQWLDSLSEDERIAHFADVWDETVEEFETRAFADEAEDIMMDNEEQE